MERLGFVFVLQEINPHFIAPSGERAPLIKDLITGLTWMPERQYAADTVPVKRSILDTYAQCPDVEKFPSRIGTPEPMPCANDTKSRIEHLLANCRDSFPSYHAGLPVCMPPNEGRMTTAVQDSPMV